MRTLELLTCFLLISTVSLSVAQAAPVKSNTKPQVSPTAQSAAKKAAKPAPKATRTLSEDEAIKLVSKNSDVIIWEKELEKAKSRGAGTAGFMADKDGKNWTVRVYESFPDRDTTYAFFRVDSSTHKVKKLSPDEL